MYVQGLGNHSSENVSFNSSPLSSNESRISSPQALISSLLCGFITTLKFPTHLSERFKSKSSNLKTNSDFFSNSINGTESDEDI